MPIKLKSYAGLALKLSNANVDLCDYREFAVISTPAHSKSRENAKRITHSTAQLRKIFFINFPLIAIEILVFGFANLMYCKHEFTFGALSKSMRSIFSLAVCCCCCND